MILVLDPCKLAFQPNPEGGLLQISDVGGGLLADTKILVPLGEEALKALDTEIKKRLGTSLDLSGDISQAVRDQGITEGLREGR